MWLNRTTEFIHIHYTQVTKVEVYKIHDTVPNRILVKSCLMLVYMLPTERRSFNCTVTSLSFLDKLWYKLLNKVMFMTNVIN